MTKNTTGAFARGLALACLALTLGSHVLADDTPDRFLAQLHQFRVANLQAVHSYYRFSAESDAETHHQVMTDIDAAQAIIRALGEYNAPINNRDFGKLARNYGEFSNLLKTSISDIRESGHPVAETMAAMTARAHEVDLQAEAIYKAAVSSHSESDESVGTARSAAILMARMMLQYSARANDSVSLTVPGEQDDVSLSEQAKKMDDLVALLRKGGSNQELRPIVEGVVSRWQFIRSSYLNVSDDNVPFVIDRYSRGILENLGNAIMVISNRTS